jgi:hypothetical protein
MLSGPVKQKLFCGKNNDAGRKISNPHRYYNIGLLVVGLRVEGLRVEGLRVEGLRVVGFDIVGLDVG